MGERDSMWQPAVFNFYVSEEEIRGHLETCQKMKRQGETIKKISDALLDGGKIVIEEAEKDGQKFHVLSKHDVFETVLGEIPGTELDVVMDTLVGEDQYHDLLTNVVGTNFRAVFEPSPPSEQ